MKTAKLHQLIEWANQGKKFKAIYECLAEWLDQDDFKTCDVWSTRGIVADWEYIEFSAYQSLQQKVSELEANYKELQALYEEEINLAEHQRGRKLFINDEKICQKHRKKMRLAQQSSYNALKSILAEYIGPTRVENILKICFEKALKGEEK